MLYKLIYNIAYIAEKGTENATDDSVKCQGDWNYTAATTMKIQVSTKQKMVSISIDDLQLEI